MPGSERQRELKRRRHRRKQIAKFTAKAAKASPSDKEKMAVKLRKLTPGCEVIITRLSLEDR